MSAQYNLGVRFLAHCLAAGGFACGVLAMMAIMSVPMGAAPLRAVALHAEPGERVRAGFPSLAIGDHADPARLACGGLRVAGIVGPTWCGHVGLCGASEAP